jgi:hypothetical protein
MPLTADAALALGLGAWREPAFRNRKKIEWQAWAQEKYRRLGAGPVADRVAAEGRGLYVKARGGGSSSE